MNRRLLVVALVTGLASALEAQVKPVPPTPPAYPLPPIPPSIGGDMGAAIKHLRDAEILLKKSEMVKNGVSMKLLENAQVREMEKAMMHLERLEKSGYPHFEMRGHEEQAQQSPDSLWAAGRAAINRGGFTQAVSLLNSLWRRYPRSQYAGDALYWEAFALRRLGSTTRLRTALDRLEKQERDYKDAATRSEAAVLKTQIRGELAQRGDARAAEVIAAQAAEVGEAPRAAVSVVAPAAGQAPQPPDAPRAARPVTTRVSPVRAGRRNSQVPGCPSEDDDERVAALNALQQMDAELAMPILTKVLAKREKCSETLRRKAVFLVSQQKSAESADLLLQAAKTDPDREVKQNAVFWLGQVRDERAVTILGELLRSSDDYELQERAIFALSQHKSESAGAAMRAYAQLESAPIDLRGKTIFWLAQQRSSENGPFLRELYGKLQDEGLKEQVFQGLSQMRDQANAAWLLGIAQSPNEPMKMRTKALFWAAQSKEVPLADFTALYDKVTDQEMKEQLIFAYAQRKDPAAVDKLMDIARKDANKELRGKAIFWLSQTKDPRVAKFLEELIIQ